MVISQSISQLTQLENHSTNEFFNQRTSKTAVTENNCVKSIPYHKVGIAVQGEVKAKSITLRTFIYFLMQINERSKDKEQEE